MFRDNILQDFGLLNALTSWPNICLLSYSQFGHVKRTCLCRSCGACARHWGQASPRARCSWLCLSPWPVKRGRPHRRGEDRTPEVCGDGRQRPEGYASSPTPTWLPQTSTCSTPAPGQPRRARRREPGYTGLVPPQQFPGHPKSTQ